ncbi:MAG: hypothetical protein ACLUEK_15450 [Oscillospiraceae bacterium]
MSETAAETDSRFGTAEVLLERRGDDRQGGHTHDNRRGRVPERLLTCL